MKGFLLLTGWLLATICLAQESRKARLDSIYTEPYLNPTVSAIVLPKGFIEINNSAAFLTTTKLFNGTSRLENLNARVSNFSDLVQVTYGVSKNGRFNLGVDMLYNKFRVDIDPSSSPFKVFGSDSALAQDGAINTLGLRFRWRPQHKPKKNNNSPGELRRTLTSQEFVVQGFLYQPVYKPRESQTSFRLQVVKVFELGPYLYLYGQAGLGYAFPKNNISGSLSIPATAVFQYQLRPTTGLLAIVAHTMSIGINDKTAAQFNAFGTQLGAGFQVQPSLRFGVNAFYTRYLLGKNTGAFDSVTIGIRSVI